jgi:protocatechuate 3,4-dioxygenase beta subunit
MLDLPDQFAPYDEAVQPGARVVGYGASSRRNPAHAPFRRPYTRSELTGPIDLTATKLAPGPGNMAVVGPGRMAMGSLIHIAGRVLDEDARPVRNAVVEVWQANASGRYHNPLDARDAPLDPNFLGHDRVVTDEHGCYAFFSIKPGAYPVPGPGRWWRPPHVHFSIVGPSTLTRLVTQMYFAGDPLNPRDRILSALPDEASRNRLIATQADPAEVDGEWLGYRFDIVLRGRHATPPAP